jgi:hypothetical protein
MIFDITEKNYRKNIKFKLMIQKIPHTGRFFEILAHIEDNSVFFPSSQNLQKNIEIPATIVWFFKKHYLCKENNMA